MFIKIKNKKNIDGLQKKEYHFKSYIETAQIYVHSTYKDIN